MAIHHQLIEFDFRFCHTNKVQDVYVSADTEENPDYCINYFIIKSGELMLIMALLWLSNQVCSDVHCTSHREPKRPSFLQKES